MDMVGYRTCSQCFLHQCHDLLGLLRCTAMLLFFPLVLVALSK